MPEKETVVKIKAGHIERRNKGTKRSIRGYWFSWSMAILSSASVACTIYFAYISSQNGPIAIFSNPLRTVLALNVLSQITVYLLGSLADNLLDNIRWALASSDNGISALTFLVLSPSTTSWALLAMLFKRSQLKSVRHRGCPFGHQIWGSQKYIHTSCHANAEAIADSAPSWAGCNSAVRYICSDHVSSCLQYARARRGLAAAKRVARYSPDLRHNDNHTALVVPTDERTSSPVSPDQVR